MTARKILFTDTSNTAM